MNEKEWFIVLTKYKSEIGHDIDYFDSLEKANNYCSKRKDDWFIDELIITKLIEEVKI